jgi:hypothetical protein
MHIYLKWNRKLHELWDPQASNSDVGVLMQKFAMAVFGLKYHFYVAAQ